MKSGRPQGIFREQEFDVEHSQEIEIEPPGDVETLANSDLWILVGERSDTRIHEIRAKKHVVILRPPVGRVEDLPVAGRVLEKRRQHSQPQFAVGQRIEIAPTIGGL